MPEQKREATQGPFHNAIAAQPTADLPRVSLFPKPSARPRAESVPRRSAEWPTSTFMPAPCCVHEGLVWHIPDRKPRSWHDAGELSHARIAGIGGWRLPSACELARFFRAANRHDIVWPSGFYWSRTLGKNGFPFLVNSDDADLYVIDGGDNPFLAALVRRL